MIFSLMKDNEIEGMALEHARYYVALARIELEKTLAEYLHSIVGR